MPSQKKVILITGAGGFIGRRAVEYFSSNGWKVRAMLHKGLPRKQENVDFIIGDIRDKIFLNSALSGVDYVLHLAGRKSDERDSYQVNVLGAINLIEAIKKSQVKKTVNVSTASTRISNKGVYALTKTQADREFFESGINVVTLRPSIIYGDFEGGIFGTLANATKGKLIPLFSSSKTLFWPIHIEDLLKSFEIALTKNLPSNDYDLGGIDKLQFREIIDLISLELWKKRAKTINLPLGLGIMASKLFSLSNKPRISKSNVLGGAYTADLDVQKFFRDFKFKPRSFSQGLKDLNAEDWLARKEAKTLLEYISSLSFPKIQVSKKLLNDFIEAQKVGGTWLKENPRNVIKNHKFLHSLDLKTTKRKNSLLQKKLILASAIVETSPEGAEWILAENQKYFSQTLKSIMSLFKAYLFLPLVKSVKTEKYEKI